MFSFFCLTIGLQISFIRQGHRPAEGDVGLEHMLQPWGAGKGYVRFNDDSSSLRNSYFTFAWEKKMEYFYTVRTKSLKAQG